VKNLTSHVLSMTVILTIIGGLLHRINASPSEQITFPSGGEATVSCPPFLGLGHIQITVTADGFPKSSEGYQLFFLTLLQP